MGRFLQIEADFGPMETELQKFALRIQGEQLAPRMGKGALEEVRQSYESEIDPDGGAWPALSPKYAEYKDRVRPGKAMLHFDDALFASLGFRTEGTAAEIGSIGGPPYAAVHNFGGGNNIPQREYAGVSDAFIENMKADIEVYIESGEWAGTLE